jgi:hypothetical protein
VSKNEIIVGRRIETDELIALGLLPEGIVKDILEARKRPKSRTVSTATEVDHKNNVITFDSSR